MSTSESELRAALAEGEGEGLNADALIGRARALRHTRRVRLGQAAAAVVALGAVGTGSWALHGGSSGSADSSAAGGANAATLQQGDAAGANSAAKHGSAGSAAGGGAACLARVPDVATPAPGAAGTSEPLFTGEITSVTVCGYRAEQPGEPARFDAASVFHDGDARRLAASLNAASTRAAGCQDGSAGRATALVLYATDEAGTPQPPVLVRSGCGQPVTNGTAIRYGWTPPAELAGPIARLTR